MASTTVRTWLMGMRHVEGLCSECWLPGLWKMVFAFEYGATERVLMNERVSCFDCGNPQDNLTRIEYTDFV